MSNAMPSRRCRPAVEQFESRLVPSVTDYLQGLYQDALHRTAGQTEITYWINQMNLVGTGEVVRQIVSSHEAHTRVVETAYNELLHRAVDPAGRDTFANLLDAGQSVIDVRSQILASAEYQNAHVDDRAFVRGLYHDALGRTSDDITGENFWLNVLHSGGNRNQVIAGFLTSDEGLGREIHRDFTEFLKRFEGLNERNFWLDQIHRGRALDLIRQDFVRSGEYETAHGFAEAPGHP